MRRMQKVALFMLLLIIIGAIGTYAYLRIDSYKPKVHVAFGLEGIKGSHLFIEGHVNKDKTSGEYTKKIVVKVISREDKWITINEAEEYDFNRLFREAPDFVKIALKLEDYNPYIEEMILQLSDRVELYCMIDKTDANKVMIMLDGKNYDEIKDTKQLKYMEAMLEGLKGFFDKY
ncbi:MAG: hypothetical protein M0P99_04720 [Candidatus Cloacimonetes bacterium]|nr:hypothetical protein [Candidatus Cloacimonadota bacterium]